jgi:hypothetical protein
MVGDQVAVAGDGIDVVEAICRLLLASALAVVAVGGIHTPHA